MYSFSLIFFVKRAGQGDKTERVQYKAEEVCLGLQLGRDKRSLFVRAFFFQGHISASD